MTIIGTLPFTITNGTTGNATQVQANYDKIVTDVNANAAEAVATTASLATKAANGANSDITSITGLTTPLSRAQGGSAIYIGGVATGTAFAQVVASVVPSGFALFTGVMVVFIGGFNNAGSGAAFTLNVGGTGVKDVRMAYGAAGSVGTADAQDIALGQMAMVIYDGTGWLLVNKSA